MDRFPMHMDGMGDVSIKKLCTPWVAVFHFSLLFFSGACGIFLLYPLMARQDKTMNVMTVQM